MNQKQAETIGQTLIPTINELQDIFNEVQLDFKIELPQVAVVGSQSSGKSSVLEALVGRDFLPRGPNICTRRPLVLQLVKSDEGSQEQGEFLHKPTKLFTNFEEIRQEIENETDRLLGTNKNISNSPIRLKISSPLVLTMTLVDLPGIARVPVGDQPNDIEARLRSMIFEYIRHPTCIILAVSAANVDLANSDAISMAQSVDPDGNRTIGVITKLDIMDKGTDASNILKNQVIPLRLGYIAVINRSQDAINNKLPMQQSRKEEEKFFKSRLEYRDVLNLCSVNNLARRLNYILVHHIYDILPGLKQKIEEVLQDRQEELELYGEELLLDSSAMRGSTLLQLVSIYTNQFISVVDGRDANLPNNELAGGARIRYIFQEIYVKGLQQINSQTLTDEEIWTAIKNSAGVSGTLLIPTKPFEILVRKTILKLLTPALQCLNFVYDELIRISGTCVPSDIGRFPSLEKYLANVVQDYIKSGAMPAERMLRDLINCEHAFINMDHPDFIGGPMAIQKAMEIRAMRQGKIRSTITTSKYQLPDVDTRQQPMHKTNSVSQVNNRVGLKAINQLDTQNGHNNSASSSSQATKGDAQTSAQKPTNPAPPVSNPNERTQLVTPTATQNVDNPSQNTWFQHLFQRPEYQAGVQYMANPQFSDQQQLSFGAIQTQQGGLQQRHSSKDSSPKSNQSNNYKQEHQHQSGQQSYQQLVMRPPQIHISAQKPQQEQEELLVEVTRLLVQSYFEIVKRNIQDMVPKSVMYFLVIKTRQGLHQHLIKQLYREDLFEKLMQERIDVVEKRAKCQKAVKALKKAVQSVEQVPMLLRDQAQDIDLVQRLAPINDQESFGHEQIGQDLGSLSISRKLTNNDSYSTYKATQYARNQVQSGYGPKPTSEVFGF